MPVCSGRGSLVVWMGRGANNQSIRPKCISGQRSAMAHRCDLEPTLAILLLQPCNFELGEHKTTFLIIKIIRCGIVHRFNFQYQFQSLGKYATVYLQIEEPGVPRDKALLNLTCFSLGLCLCCLGVP